MSPCSANSSEKENKRFVSSVSCSASISVSESFGDVFTSASKVAASADAANFQGKSEHSVNDVDLDPELMALFKTFKEKATGAFVIESEVAPKPGVTYTHYRANKDFKKLTRWLRAHCVVGMRPLHILRKEFGSQINEKHGIYAASQALRHRDIAITTKHYVDQKKKVTVGMGHLLTPADLPHSKAGIHATAR